MALAPAIASSRPRASTPLGCFSPSLSTSWLKRSRSSARSIASGEVPRIGTPASRQRHRELQRGLAAELHDDAGGLLALDNRHHVLEGERLEVEAIGNVVIGRDGFGIAIDHDGLEAGGLEREARMHAAVVELDALPDAIRAASENHYLTAGSIGLGLVLALVGRVVDTGVKAGNSAPQVSTSL